MKHRNQRGFTMIEVLVAVLVLAIGLLGFALLQTMSVRMAQSANYRTQATNLATEILDQMRANRLSAAEYAAQASFAAGSRTSAACRPGTATQTVAQVSEFWKCQVVRALGDSAGATVAYANGRATVTITWGERDPTASSTSFSVVTNL